jgi:16S rRNA (cytosine967-C5)-methyltransferase
MNLPPAVSERADGYVQDAASQWVSAYVGAAAGQRVGDLCAAPGGKATALAAGLGSGERPGLVVAADVRPSRAGLVAENAARLGLGNLAVVVSDGRRAPLRPASLDSVLVDAPCSGLGVLHRRPDARWRLQPGDVDRLAGLQRELLAGAVEVVRPGGLLVYSVCTLTRAETVHVDEWLEEHFPGLVAEPRPGPPWEGLGRGARLLPQAAGTDGMYLVGLRRARG